MVPAVRALGKAMQRPVQDRTLRSSVKSGSTCVVVMQQQLLLSASMTLPSWSQVQCAPAASVGVR